MPTPHPFRGLSATLLSYADQPKQSGTIEDIRDGAAHLLLPDGSMVMGGMSRLRLLHPERGVAALRGIVASEAFRAGAKWGAGFRDDMERHPRDEEITAEITERGL